MNGSCFALQNRYFVCKQHNLICLIVLILLLAVGQAQRFTDAEIELIKSSFLKRFGLKEVPEQRSPLLPLPDYIWDFYQEAITDDLETIRHYYPQKFVKHNQRFVDLQYNLSVSVEKTKEEQVTKAVMKIKVGKGADRKRILLHDLNEEGSDIRRIIDSKFVEVDRNSDHKWIDMDATEALTRKRKYKNLVDLEVEVHETHSHLRSNGLTSISSILSDRSQAFALVVYIETNDRFAKVRKKRRANGWRRHQHRKHNHRVAIMENSLCRRKELLVNFTELNWQDWIIAPSGYSAYQCQGECPQPLANHFNATNHAIVQGLINSIHPHLVPAPCCIPVEMGPLPILYIDVESKVIIKNYPDMVVLSCGCR